LGLLGLTVLVERGREQCVRQLARLQHVDVIVKQRGGDADTLGAHRQTNSLEHLLPSFSFFFIAQTRSTAACVLAAAVALTVRRLLLKKA
jgi:hypothetical protein